MGGTIEPISDRQQISDLKRERNRLENLLLDIVNAKGQKSRKEAIDKAREVIYPPIKNENTDSFWKARLNWWKH